MQTSERPENSGRTMRTKGFSLGAFQAGRDASTHVVLNSQLNVIRCWFITFAVIFALQKSRSRLERLAESWFANCEDTRAVA